MLSYTGPDGQPWALDMTNVADGENADQPGGDRCVRALVMIPPDRDVQYTLRSMRALLLNAIDLVPGLHPVGELQWDIPSVLELPESLQERVETFLRRAQRARIGINVIRIWQAVEEREEDR